MPKITIEGVVNTPEDGDVDKISEAQVKTWSVVVGDSFRRGGLKDGLDALQSMLQSGNARDPYAFAVAIRELGKMGEITAAEETYKLMMDLGVKCTPISVDAMISAYSSSGVIDKAILILEDALYGRIGEFQPVFQSYQSIAKCFAKSNNLLGVLYIYQLLQENDGVMMDESTSADKNSTSRSISIFSLTRDEKLSAIWECLLQVICKSSTIPSSTCKALVLSLSNRIYGTKRKDDVEDVFKAMLVDIVRLLCNLPKLSSEKTVANRRGAKNSPIRHSGKSAAGLLHQYKEFCHVESDRLSTQSTKTISSFCLNSVSISKLSAGVYSPMIERLTNEYLLLPVESKEGKALCSDIERLVNDLAYEHQTKPDRLCYECLISVFLQQGRFSDARDIMLKMVLRRNMRPNEVTWKKFVSAHASRGMYMESLACIDEMMSHNVKVSADVWQLVQDCVAQTENKKIIELVDRLAKKTIN